MRYSNIIKGIIAITCTIHVFMASATYRGMPRNPSDVPNPSEYSWDNWVSDPDNLLYKHNINSYVNLFSDLKRYKFPCGSSYRPYQVGVAVINKMSGPYVGKQEIFADMIFNKWGIGYPECNNGVLLFASYTNKQFVIATGNGYVSDILDVNTKAQIIGKMVEYMKNHHSFLSNKRIALTETLEYGTNLISAKLLEKSFTYYGSNYNDRHYDILGYSFATVIILMLLYRSIYKMRGKNNNERMWRSKYNSESCDYDSDTQRSHYTSPTDRYGWFPASYLRHRVKASTKAHHVPYSTQNETKKNDHVQVSKQNVSPAGGSVAKGESVSGSWSESKTNDNAVNDNQHKTNQRKTTTIDEISNSGHTTTVTVTEVTKTITTKNIDGKTDNSIKTDDIDDVDVDVVDDTEIDTKPAGGAVAVGESVSGSW